MSSATTSPFIPLRDRQPLGLAPSPRRQRHPEHQDAFVVRDRVLPTAEARVCRPASAVYSARAVAVAELGDSPSDAPAAARSAEDSATAVRARSAAVALARCEAAAANDSSAVGSAREDSVVADSPVAAEDDCSAAYFADIRREWPAATDDWSPDDCSAQADLAEADIPDWADSSPADSAAAGWAVAGCSAG